MNEMRWMDYRNRLAGGGVSAILPLGTLEQHGAHMAMDVVQVLPTQIAALAAERVGALVAPVLPYGYISQPRSGDGIMQECKCELSLELQLAPSGTPLCVEVMA